MSLVYEAFERELMKIGYAGASLDIPGRPIVRSTPAASKVMHWNPSAPNAAAQKARMHTAFKARTGQSIQQATSGRPATAKPASTTATKLTPSGRRASRSDF